MKHSGQISAEPIGDSELVLNPDGSVYHLKLLPEQISDQIILVGDPGRVERVSSRFDRVDEKVSNREFVTHTGELNGKRLTVMSSGIGTDNIDIVINELDALVNIDLQNRVPRQTHHQLDIVRIGTSGSLQESLPVDSFIFSDSAIGLDGVMGFYDIEMTDREADMLERFLIHTQWPSGINVPYVAEGDSKLISHLAKGYAQGITMTANGFYGPQGRSLRVQPSDKTLNERYASFSFQGLQITNYEMETSALYGLGGVLGHRTCTACAIIANRYRQEYSKDYKLTVDRLIDHILSALVEAS